MASGGSWWPSLGWASLPSFDSFTTRHWQRRLLRYLIKRTLAGFLSIPEEDIEKSTYLDADLGSGSLRLRDVELNQEAINDILSKQLGADQGLSPVQIRLLSSRLSNVQILVGASDASSNNPPVGEWQNKAASATERLFNAPIHVLASDINLDFRVDPATSGTDFVDTARAEDAEADAPLDLGASILHVAEDYIHEDSIADEAEAPDDEPFGLPGGFSTASSAGSGASQSTLTEQQQVGLIAKVIETLLQRLRISVNNVTINFSLGDLMKVQVRLTKIDSRTEMNAAKTSRTQSRVLDIEGMHVYYALGSYPQPTVTRPQPFSRSSGSEVSSVSDRTESSDDLAMSMAIADLRMSAERPPVGKPVCEGTIPRHSQECDAASSVMEESVYMDAADEGEGVDNMADNGAPRTESQKYQPASSTYSGLEQEDWQQFFGAFNGKAGSSDAAIFTIRLVTSYGTAPEADSTLKSSERVEVSMPVVALLLRPQLVEASLTLFSQFTPEGRTRSAVDPRAGKSRSASARSSLLHICMSNIYLFVHLQETTAPLAELVRAAADAPLRMASVGLYIHVDTIEGVYRLGKQDGKDAKLAISSFGLYTQGGRGLRPLLLPDPGLIWQFDPEVLRPGQSAPSSGDWHLQQRHGIQDWLADLPTGATSLSASTRLPMLKDALAVRLSGSDVKVNVQPIHLWLDIEHLDTFMQAVIEAGQLEHTRPEKSQPHAPERQHRSPATSSPALSQTYSLTIPCVRADVRCPMIPSPEHTMFGELRSGLVTVSLHDLSCKAQSLSQPLEIQAGVHAPLELSVANAFVFLGSSSDRKTEAILWTGPSSRGKPLSLALQHTRDPSSDQLDMCLLVNVPLVQALVSKRHVDALLYAADDLTRAAGRFTHLLTKMVGSSAQSSHLQNSGVDAALSSSSHGRAVSEASLSLSGVQVMCEKAKLSLLLLGDSSEVSRTLEADTTSLNLNVNLKLKTSDDLVMQLALADLSVIDHGKRSKCLLKRQKSGGTPMIRLRLASCLDDTLSKHSSLTLNLSSLEATLVPDMTLLADLIQLFKLPPGDFLEVVPTKSTRIYMEASQTLIKVLPFSLSSAVALSLGRFDVSSKICQGATATRCRMQIEDVQVWAADAPRDARSGHHHIKDLGYAELVHCAGLGATVKARHGPGGGLAIVLDPQYTRISACPDTILCITNFIAELSPPTSAVPESDTRQSAPLSNSLLGTSGSLLHAPPKQSTVSPVITPVSAIDGETIGILGQERLAIDPGWLCRPRLRAENSKDSLVPVLSLRIKPSKVTIAFFEGYDYDRTRAFVRTTVKATRRKLEKIKQLLAEGQMPEQTIEEAADPLLQSIFLPTRRKEGTSVHQADFTGLGEENDTWKRIVAFDDELDQEEDLDSDSLLMWENVRDRPTVPRRGSSSSSRTPLPRPARASCLKRPKIPALEVHLESLEVTLATFARDASMASRMLLLIGDLSIVDNIKTSTWHKFLTELRPRDGGITRPTGTPMVRVLLKMLRSVETGGSEEADLSVKLAPLRLHVDQDALDFLKAFFAFKIDSPPAIADPLAPRAAVISPKPDRASGGFIQRVEISAVKIKLDYKPKRVDYHALRQGKAIEMMNFFHFEASEMVLRHLVLSGVPSWVKVGDMLQDIWTPDVKANQLADFLSGINPVRSVVNVGHGVADLVLLPVGQYRKDGRLIRGLQRGGTKFAKSTAMEAIKLGARLATGTQVILEHAEHVLGGRIDVPQVGGSGGSSDSPGLSEQPRSEWLLTATEEQEDDGEVESGASTEPLSKFSQQPEDVKVGLQAAYKSLSGNVRSAAETILAVPMEVYERSSEGPVRAVVRAVPIAVIKPMIGASEAVSKTLLGLRNTLDPGAKEEIQDKYKRRSNTG